MCKTETKTKMQIDAKHTNKWRNMPCSPIGKFIIAKMSILTKLNLQIKMTNHKSMQHFRYQQFDYKIHTKVLRIPKEL